MAGLSKRFCDRCIGDSESFRGTCGGCQGTWDNCDSSEENCGHWQDPDCGASCGDGHDCPLYIDITFTLNSFLIQDAICCDSTPPLTEPCGGTYWTTQRPGVISPWSSVTGSEVGEVTYNATTHHIRLMRGYGTRADSTGGEECFCFYGGFWSGNCGCNKCCCCDNDLVSCDSEPSTYENCEAEYVRVAGVSGCADQVTYPTEICDPDNNPCYLVTTGWASSLDEWGDHPTEQGGSDGPAMCTDHSISDVCDNEGTECGRACWNCGNFLPHHIEAYMSFEYVGCVGSWQLEIKGLTEASRSVMGVNNLEQGGIQFGGDCVLGGGGANDCSDPAFGGRAEPAWGYIGRWWGKYSHCNASGRCSESSSGNPAPAFEGRPELLTQGCGCPPHTSFSGSVKVSNAIKAFHPATRYFDADVPSPGQGGLMTCCMAHSDCGNPDYLAANPPPPWDGTNYYGKPIVWDTKCMYCDLCDGDWSYCTGLNCNVSACCSANAYHEDDWCSCQFPTAGFNDTDGPNVNDVQIPDDICATCTISINPNNNDEPAWVDG